MKIDKAKAHEKLEEYVKNIYDAGAHLSDLINQVLDLTKIETGKR